MKNVKPTLSKTTLKFWHLNKPFREGLRLRQDKEFWTPAQTSQSRLNRAMYGLELVRGTGCAHFPTDPRGEVSLESKQKLQTMEGQVQGAVLSCPHRSARAAAALPSALVAQRLSPQAKHSVLPSFHIWGGRLSATTKDMVKESKHLEGGECVCVCVGGVSYHGSHVWENGILRGDPGSHSGSSISQLCDFGELR